MDTQVIAFLTGTADKAQKKHRLQIVGIEPYLGHQLKAGKPNCRARNELGEMWLQFPKGHLLANFGCAETTFPLPAHLINKRGCMNNDLTMQRYKIENEEKWRDKIKEIPFIQFPSEWKVKVIPPFGGAYARFQVTLPSGELKSVYLDFEDRLGTYGEPYWEVYPYQDDIGRCDMKEVETLIKLISDTTNKGE